MAERKPAAKRLPKGWFRAGDGTLLCTEKVVYVAPDGGGGSALRLTTGDEFAEAGTPEDVVRRLEVAAKQGEAVEPQPEPEPEPEA